MNDEPRRRNLDVVRTLNLRVVKQPKEKTNPN